MLKRKKTGLLTGAISKPAVVLQNSLPDKNQ